MTTLRKIFKISIFSLILMFVSVGYRLSVKKPENKSLSFLNINQARADVPYSEAGYGGGGEGGGGSEGGGGCGCSEGGSTGDSGGGAESGEGGSGGESSAGGDW